MNKPDIVFGWFRKRAIREWAALDESHLGAPKRRKIEQAYGMTQQQMFVEAIALIAPPPATETDDWCISHGIAWTELLGLMRATIVAHDRCHLEFMADFRREYDSAKAPPLE